LAPYGILPVADELTRAYWDAAREGKLALQRCQSCKTYNHPPVFLCKGCYDPSAELVVEPVSGKGTLRQWYVCHDTSIEGWEDRVPYAVIGVELDEQANLLMMGNILNYEYGELGEGLDFGMRLEVVFDKANDTYSIPQWQPES
jgi:uncharacterized OB-fold protein